MAVCIFYKNIFRGGKATQPEPPKIEHYHSRFEDLAFWLIEVIVSFFWVASDKI